MEFLIWIAIILGLIGYSAKMFKKKNKNKGIKLLFIAFVVLCIPIVLFVILYYLCFIFWTGRLF